MEEGLERWALIGFDGTIAILISNNICIAYYMEACKIAEELAREMGLKTGIAINMNSIWYVLMQSAKSCNQEIF